MVHHRLVDMSTVKNPFPNVIRCVSKGLACCHEYISLYRGATCGRDPKSDDNRITGKFINRLQFEKKSVKSSVLNYLTLTTCFRWYFAVS